MGWSRAGGGSGAFGAVSLVVALLASLLVAVAAEAVVRAENQGVERSPTGRYIVELDPQAVSPWMLRVAGDFGDDLRVQAVKSRVAGVVDTVDGEVVYDYGVDPYLAVATDDPDALAGLDGVVSVRPELVVHRQLDTTLGVINATNGDLDGMLAGSRLDGSGWAVAVIDDGIDLDHPYFTTGGTRIVAQGCYTSDLSCPGSAASSTAAGSAVHPAAATHGTHVAGIAAGDAGPGNRRGVARAASIIPIRVFDQDGGASELSLYLALERVLALTSTVSVAAINMSLGTTTAYAGTCDGLSTRVFDVVAQLRTAGVATVVAAGNGGFINGVSWPACLSNVVPVAATDNSDNVASFSNVSNLVSTSGLAAPGVGVRSAANTAGPSNGEKVLSGTSMAAPHVAGAVALLRQAVGAGPTVADIVSALRTTDVLVDDVQVKNIPRLLVSSAVQSVLPTGVVGTVVDGTNSTPVSLGSTAITVSLTPTSAPGGVPVEVNASTSPSGTFRILGLAAGTWSASVSAAHYRTPQSTALSITDGAVAAWPSSLVAPTGAVTGTVSVSGLPRSVDFTFTPDSGNPWPAFTTTSAVPGDGSFSFSGVRAGQWKVEARAGTDVSTLATVTVNDLGTSAVSPAVLELSFPTATQRFTISSALTGGPAASVPVSFEFSPTEPLDGRTGFVSTVTTNGSGLAEVPGLRLGTWSVTLSATGFEPKVVGLALNTANAIEETSTSLEAKLGTVAGVLSFVGEVQQQGAPQSLRPLESSTAATLVFEPTGNTAGRTRQTRTVSVASTGGSFAVSDLYPGDWLVSGSSFGYRSRSTQAVTVVGGQETTDVQLIMDPVVELTTVTPITPSSGPAFGGTTVTLSGVHLDTVTSVRVGSNLVAAAAFRVQESDRLVFDTPPGSGTVSVTLFSSVTVSSSTSFMYVAASSGSPPGGGGGSSGGGSSGGGGGGGSSSSDAPPATATVAAPRRPSDPVRVEVELRSGALGLQFSGVAGTGEVAVQERSGAPSSGAAGLRLVGRYVEITASSLSFQNVELCVPYAADDPTALGVHPADMRLLHFVGDLGRRDITTRVDTSRRVVCGITDRFSPFAIGVPATERIAGNDRYVTAVQLSQEFYPQGASTVYVASGTGFADALAAGAAAAAAGGPVLLTAPGALPASVRSELERLAPTQVVLVGGVGAVSSPVEAAVRAAVPRASVGRVAGLDRYATAVAVSKRAFPNGASTVYLATGRSFPDALAGAAAAGRDGAPVLLVPGSSIPSSVADELVRLGPERVVLLGGTTALTSSVGTAVQARLPGAVISRLQGADRYATAASVARTFGAGGTVFVATGRTFPDALAGAAVAGRERGPVIVVPDGTLPTSLRSALTRLQPSRMVVLGGRTALSSAVEVQVAAFVTS